MASAPQSLNGRARQISASKAEPIDHAAAVDWAKANGVRAAPSETFQARLNTRRAQLGLPRFLIKTKPRLRLITEPAAPRVAIKALARTEDELLSLVTTHDGTITCKVTPEIAGWLLSLNTGNRPVMKSNLDRFRAILKTDRWQNTGEPIIVSREGVLNDGQHRLLAIRDTKITAELDVRFGVPRDAFYVTGFGKRRTTAHVLGVEGYSNTSCQASIARLLWAYDSGQMGTVRQSILEPDETLKIVGENDHIGHVAARVQRLRFAPCRCGGFGFTLVLAARKLPMDRIFEFADLANTGLAGDLNSPTYRLHQKLGEMRAKRERIGQVDLAALTIKAWNAWITGGGLAPMRLTDADRTSAGFPQLRWA
ncbi:MAG: hypothetical protein INR71_10760 [Terriglobus roseus]|nr:hypothetical protein [Terriglobus roseus]